MGTLEYPQVELTFERMSVSVFGANPPRNDQDSVGRHMQPQTEHISLDSWTFLYTVEDVHPPQNIVFRIFI